MHIEKGKISIRQVLIIWVLGMASPSLRIMPNFISEYAKNGSWVTTLIAILPIILLIIVLAKLMNRYPNKGLYEILKIILGKIGGNILSVIYLFFAFLLFVMYARYFGERFLSTILVETPIEFLLIIMFIFVSYVVRNGLEAFARTAEFFLILLIAIFLIVFITVIPEIKIENLYPVTYYDIGGILKSTIYPVGLGSFIVFLTFLGKNISHKEKTAKTGIISTIILGILCTIVILTTVGLFGYEIMKEFQIPYFITLKSIEIMNTLERVESIFIAVWVVTDFTILTTFAYVITSLTKDMLKLKTRDVVNTPLMFLAYITALYIADNTIELEIFSKEIVLVSAIILCFVLPIIIWGIGKIRKIV